MQLITVVAGLLVAQAMMGAFDTFFNHEWRERLPHQPWAAPELTLHALRSAQYTALFAGIAWFDWHGLWSWFLLGVMSLEYLVTIVDSVVEDRTRRLSAVERTNHMLLALNTGLYMAFFAAQMAHDWNKLPSAIIPANRPWPLAFLLTVSAIATAVWAVRDALAARRISSAAHLPA